MIATGIPDPDDRDQTESHDSKLVEFTDTGIDLAPRPVREVILRHLPDWLRRAAQSRQRVVPAECDPGALAHCLLQQARLLVQLRRHPEAASPVAEAERLYQQAADAAGLADCYRVAAEVHQGMGELDKAVELLRREADLRRRLAA